MIRVTGEVMLGCCKCYLSPPGMCVHVRQGEGYSARVDANYGFASVAIGNLKVGTPTTTNRTKHPSPSSPPLLLLLIMLAACCALYLGGHVVLRLQLHRVGRRGAALLTGQQARALPDPTG